MDENRISECPAIQDQIRELLDQLQRRRIVGHFNCARAILDLLKATVGSCHWTTTSELLTLVGQVAQVLVKAQPFELVVGSMLQRVVHIIKREGTLHDGSDRENLDHDKTFGEPPSTTGYPTSPPLRLKPILIEAINELQTEVEDARLEVCSLALEHIHANEIVLTAHGSGTIEAFLREAADQGRICEVICAESAMSLSGQRMACNLAACGIDTTIVADSAVYAIMARVNQVFLPCKAILANGGLIAPSGGHMIALAANELSVPVVCITALFKLSPTYHHGQDPCVDLRSPHSIVAYGEVDDLDALNPAYDYVPPELVDLYITNTGGHQTTYVYRLLDEIYNSENLIVE